MELSPRNKRLAELGVTWEESSSATEYLRWLKKRYGYLALAGLMEEDEPVPVEKLYVPLRFSPEPIPETADDKKIKEAGVDGETGEICDITYWLNRQRFLTIAGPPGSGKTTLVQEILTELILPRQTPLNQAFPVLLPVPIILRRYPVHAIQSVDELLDTFWKEVEEEVQKKVPGFNRAQLDKYRQGGEFLYLFDGLDEVGGVENRQKVFLWGVEIFAREPRNYIILTARPPGYEGLRDFKTKKAASWWNALLEKLSFEVRVAKIDQRIEKLFYSLPQLHILPFNDQNIGDFLENWFAERGIDKKERETKRESFLDARRERGERLMALARRPSFLTLMAFVHTVSGELPHTRAALYQSIIKAYVHQLDKVRQLHRDFPNWDQQDKMRILAYIAWRSQETDKKDGRILIWNKADLVQIIREGIDEYGPTLRTVEREHAEKLLDYFLSRTGILSEPAEDKVQFAHLSFQEFLTAWFLHQLAIEYGVTETVSKILYPKLDRESWREVAHLFLSIHTESTTRGYTHLLMALEAKEVSHLLFLCEILGSHEIPFGDEEKAAWMETAVLWQGLHPPQSIWDKMKKEAGHFEPLRDILLEILRSWPELESKARLERLNRTVLPREASGLRKMLQEKGRHLEGLFAALRNELEQSSRTTTFFERILFLALELGLNEKPEAIAKILVSKMGYFQSHDLIEKFWEKDRHPFRLTLLRWEIEAFLTSEEPRLSRILLERTPLIAYLADLLLLLPSSVLLMRFKKPMFKAAINLIGCLDLFIISKAVDDMNRALNRDSAVALAQALDLELELDLASTLARARYLTRTLDWDRDRDLAVALARARARALDWDPAWALALDRDLARTRTLARDLDSVQKNRDFHDVFPLLQSFITITYYLVLSFIYFRLAEQNGYSFPKRIKKADLERLRQWLSDPESVVEGTPEDIQKVVPLSWRGEDFTPEQKNQYMKEYKEVKDLMIEKMDRLIHYAEEQELSEIEFTPEAVVKRFNTRLIEIEMEAKQKGFID